MDNSFLNLTTEENINKIKIDKKLIPAFKKTMRNFQEYFNYMGYTDTRDYNDFFNKYIVSKNSINNIKIQCNNKPFKNDATGLYNYYKNKITIDRSLLDNPREVLDSLTHEFIHFLVMHNVRNNKIENSIIDEQYLNEPITEMLKMKILPLSYQSYYPEILMIKFWLIMNNKTLDFKDFLNEGKFYDMEFEFKELLRIYWDSLSEPEHITDALKNKNYINIQRYLIDNINIFNINNIEEYELLISKLAKRPVKDIIYMNKFYKKIECRLCNNFNINDKYRNKYLIYLKKYRELLEILYNDNNFKFKDTFYYYGCKYEIDSRRNVYVDNEFDDKATGLVLEGDNDLYKIVLKRNNLEKIELSNNKLPICKTRYKLRYNKRKELIIKHKEYLKSILYYLKFINNNEIIIDNDLLLKK